MIVMKFGGTSVGSVESIQQVRSIVQSRIDQKPVVVVSAVSGVTNLLQEFISSNNPERVRLIQAINTKHQEIIQGLALEHDTSLLTHVESTVRSLQNFSEELSLKESDEVLSMGERLSAVIVSSYFSESFESRPVDARTVLVTDSNYGAAEIIDEPTRRNIVEYMAPLIGQDIVPVVTGFIGSDQQGVTTTLGRGGSDYSAALFGYYLGAKEIQIWTDVDGVYSTDPRDDPSAVLLPEITYQEVGELAAFGAKVLHPKTMRPAVSSSIPIVIANTFNPDGPTTRVVDSTTNTGNIVAVASKKRITMVNVYAVEMLLQKGFLAKISKVFADNNISIDLISATETSVSLTLDNHEKLSFAVDQLREFSRVSVDKEAGLVTLIGQGLPADPARLTDIFKCLADNNISTKMISVGAQNVNVSLVIAKDHVMQAIKATHALCKDQIKEQP